MRFLIGTRKGLFRLERRRDGWHLCDPSFLGVPVMNAMRDPRDGSVWACIGHGHWGPKLHVSTDDMKQFEERTCPAFPEGYEVSAVTDMGTEKGKASVKVLYTIVPAGPAGHYHIGTDPGGMFTTTDAAKSWTLQEPLWNHRNKDGWFPGGGGVMLHAIHVHPEDPKRMHIGISCAGVYETRDGGETWEPRNSGVRADFLPNTMPVVGQDTHSLRRHRRNRDLLWQQNHCGTYRSTDAGRSWREITEGLPSQIGFCIALHDEDEGRAWCIPMDSDERRTSPAGALAVWRTDDAGETWRAQRKGLPQKHVYDIVYRHALDIAGETLVFGTTCGNLFASTDGGESWEAISHYLPPVHSVTLEG